MRPARAALSLLTVYLLATAVTGLVEVAGVRRCGCSASCWCRRPGLTAFRWVVPIRHR